MLLGVIARSALRILAAAVRALAIPAVLVLVRSPNLEAGVFFAGLTRMDAMPRAPVLLVGLDVSPPLQCILVTADDLQEREEVLNL
jgi:hypothetical protein